MANFQRLIFIDHKSFSSPLTKTNQTTTRTEFTVGGSNFIFEATLELL